MDFSQTFALAPYFLLPLRLLERHFGTFDYVLKLQFCAE